VLAARPMKRCAGPTLCWCSCRSRCWRGPAIGVVPCARRWQCGLHHLGHLPRDQRLCLRCHRPGVAGRSCRALSTRAANEDLVALSRRFEQRLRVALYPPYTSKRHPIEHRLFCHVARRLSGVILDSHQTALEAVQRTHTQTDLTVTPCLLDTLYELGRMF